jgi:hypothetical protein
VDNTIPSGDTAALLDEGDENNNGQEKTLAQGVKAHQHGNNQTQ